MGGIPKLEDCNPGIRATGFNVVVAIEPVEEVTRGGIILTKQTTDKEAVVQTRGRIVSVGPAAFDFADFGNDKPGPGAAIVFAKLAGVRTTFADGKEGRIILDKDVAAIIEEAA